MNISNFAFAKMCKIALILLTIGLLLFISGCVESTKEVITPTPTNPLNTPPKAAASASPSSLYEGDTVSFNGLSSVDSDGSIVSYQWNFGDGETDTGATLSHKYSNAGTYTALLTVVDNDELKDIDSIKIIVNAKPTPTPIIQTTTTITTSGKNVVKIIDFVPRKGETIADLPLTHEAIRSGENKALRIDYIPENVTVWGNNLVIYAFRYLNSDDGQKVWSNYLSNETNVQLISIGEWIGIKDATTETNRNYAGKWRWFSIHKGEYMIYIGVNGDNVPMAQEKAEAIAKIIIDRYNAALW